MNATIIDGAVHHNGRPATRTELEAALDEACEILAECRESYSETYAEHRNEVAMFGDSWPGAQIQIANMNAALTDCEAYVDALVADLDARFPIYGPPRPPVPAPTFEEEPF